MTTQHDERAELSKEEKALGAFLSAMHDCKLDGGKMRAAMLKALGLAADAQAGGEAVAWRTEAAKWLRMKAEERRATNRQYPRHVECYPEWKLRALWISWLADELEADQESAPPGLEPWQDDAHPQPKAVAQGWKPVPVEPTDAMVVQGLSASGRDVMESDVEDIYRAMLSASPAAPAAAQVAQPLTDEQTADLWNASKRENLVDHVHEFKSAIDAAYGIGKDQG